MATVLMMDDRPEFLETIGPWLQARGHEVMASTDGMMGVALARKVHPAVIVLDATLPRMDGHDVLVRLKADPATTHIPVIMLSKAAKDAGCAEAAKGKVGGHVRHLERAYKPEELLREIEAALAKHRKAHPTGVR